MIVDLYPFEETLKSTDDEDEIIEKIDIGGISLIRAAAKNYNDVIIISGREQYPGLISLLKEKKGITSLEDRKIVCCKGISDLFTLRYCNFQIFQQESRITGFQGKHKLNHIL